MSALFINDVEFPVFYRAGSIDYMDGTTVARRFNGDLSETRKGYRTDLRVLRVECPRDTPREDVEAWEALLRGSDFVEVSGTLWGDPAEADARDIRVMEPLPGQIPLSFELHERGDPEVMES